MEMGTKLIVAMATIRVNKVYHNIIAHFCDASKRMITVCLF